MSVGIDFVILWVDGNDPRWLEKKNSYNGRPHTDIRIERYRDFGTLKYLLRSIEKFAPWADNIYLVTDDQRPDWMVETGKLTVVDHRDFMPREVLPIFNSNSLDLNIHRIPGLSERFVYFNDDTLFLNSVVPEDFFIGDKPVDMLALQPVVANPKNPVMSGIFMSNSLLLCRHFDKRSLMKKYPGKFFHIGYPPMYFVYNMLEMAFPLFTGFYTIHNPSPMLKSTYEKVWELEESALYETTAARFRTGNDLSQYVMREWQKLEGNFIPRNVQRHFGYADVSDDLSAIRKLLKKKPKTCCINDTNKALLDYEKTKAELIDLLESYFPNKSSFEK